jgi:hypothetical protein
VVDPTQAHEYAGYAEGFEGYDRMEEEAMFYQPEEEEASHYFRTEEVAEAKDMAEAEDDVAEDDEDEEVHAIALEPDPKPVRSRRDEVALVVPVAGPPFLGDPETTLLLSDYAKHVTIPLWVNHNDVSV